MFRRCKNGVVFYADCYPIEDISPEINCPEFRRAYYYDSASDENIRRALKDIIIKNYWLAFNQGIPEAGVNLMRIYYLDLQKWTRIYEMLDLPGYKREILTLKQTLDDLSGKLRLIEHPIVPYYERLDAAFKIKDDPHEREMKELEIWDLEDHGNKYAEALYEDIQEIFNNCAS